MIQRIRKSRITKIVSLFVAINFVIELISPLQVLALTGGPAQPEMAGFTPVDTSNMVNLFSGDFHYTIPIMTVPGPNGSYPINLNYTSGVGMEHEASWVGLGWNLNPGAINRQVRGIPDDFKGEMISKTLRQRPNNTYVFIGGGGVETAGADFSIGGNIKQSIVYNTFSGLSLSHYYGLSSSYVKGRKKDDKNLLTSANIGMNFDSNNGITTSFSLSQGKDKFSWGSSFGYNSKSGTYTFSQQFSTTFEGKDQRGKDRNFRGPGGSISFSTASSIPTVNIPYQVSTFSVDFQVGAEAEVIEGYGTIGANFCSQKTPTQTLQYPAYGVLYSDAAPLKSMQDYNLEKDIPINKHSLNMPLPMMTHDIYSITGELQGGSFRAYRSDYGHFFENSVTTTSSTVEIGGDLGLGGENYQFGVTLNSNSSSTSTEKWSSGSYDSKLKFKDKDTYAAERDEISPVLYEPFYFQMSGEMTGSDPNYLSDIGGEDAVRFEVDKNQITSTFGTKTNSYTINNKLKSDQGSDYTIGSFTRNERVKRTNNIEYKFRDTDDGVKKKHHIAEFTIANGEGSRFTYGDALYNIVEKEVSFSLNYQDFSQSLSKSVIHPYPTAYADPATPLSQRAGKEQSYSCTETPAYAYSYPLQHITSADYVDVSGDGPTDDDFGYWVKFHYTKKYTTTSPYQWRFPYQGVNFMMGDPSNRNDDKGSYNYGTKEMAYLDSIVTKTHVAIFYTSGRQDGKEAGSEYSGGLGTNPKTLNKLDSIALYSRNDRSTPIKTAIFTYNYSLCPHVYNNSQSGDNGKLTLQSVYFRYANSEKGVEDPYQFTYGDATSNYSYNPAAMDRWGNYQGNGNHFDHYVPQNSKSSVDQWAGAWLLTQVTLPSKGEIEVEYESDDYAYVQDKQAMYMAEVDVGNSSFAKDANGDYFVCFKMLPSNANANPNDYISGLQDNLLFIKYALYPEDGVTVPDYIQGYIEVVPNSATSVGNNYIKVKVKAFGIYDMHPIRFLALNYLRKSRPDLLFDGYDREDGNGDIKGLFNALLSDGFITQLKAMYGDKKFYKYCDKKTTFFKDISTVSGMKSWVRVNCVNKVKYGGGARVKSITMHDDWEKSDPSFYRQEYFYKKIENRKLISSGVAEYEPMVCAEENSLRYPVFDKTKGLFYKEHELYAEKPYGESYFPGANVGYSQVIVRSYTPDNVNLSSSGIQVHQFYTAKDFPVVTAQTGMYVDYDNAPNLISLLTIGGKQSATSAYSQGYKIELNDMHGKQKAVITYPYQATEDEKELADLAENSGYTSKVEYIYKTETNNPKRLNNRVSTLIDDNQPVSMKLGESCDFTVQMGQTCSLSEGGGLSANLISSVSPPYFIPVGLPTIDSFEEVVRYVTTTKVIYKSGILERTVAVNNGSRIETRNHHWDPYTGEVLMSSVTNDFDKPIYTYSLPAYWFYDHLGSAARNYRASYKSGWSNINDLSPFIRYDRFVQNQNQYTSDTLWKGSNNQLAVKHWRATGSSTLSLGTYEVVRSGRSNQLSASVASLTSLTDPIAERRMPFFDAFNVSDSICFHFTQCNGKEYMGKVVSTNDSLFFAIVEGYNSDFCSDSYPLTHYVAIKKSASLSGDPLTMTFRKRGKKLYVYRRNTTTLLAEYSWIDPHNYLPECQDGVLQAGAVEYTAVWSYPYVDVGNSALTPNREHYLGIRNIHRPLRSNLFVTQRKQTGINSTGYKTNIAYDGTFDYFSYFNYNQGNSENIQKPWTWSAEIGLYSPFNFEIENKNALGIYSSALYGYRNSLAVAVANNSRYCEMAFCNFEDMEIFDNMNGHLSFTNGMVNTSNGHSGGRSWNATSLRMNFNTTDSLHKADYDGKATLEKGKRYIFSCWVKKNSSSTGSISDNAGEIYSALVAGTTIPISIEDKIEGWQRLEFEFTVPSTGNDFTLYVNPFSYSFILFDDIRIHPYHAVMKSYVYDPANYRLTAELDENNYATFYNYDEEGTLVQIKKETERGIFTIQTTRQNLKKSVNTSMNP